MHAKHWYSANAVNMVSYFPPLFQLRKHSPSLQKASPSNPGPYFSNCMLNDVTSVHRCLTSFPKITIVYYYYSHQCAFKFSCYKLQVTKLRQALMSYLSWGTRYKFWILNEHLSICLCHTSRQGH